MASRSKKTTMAKLNREAATRERRLMKQIRKDQRKAEAAGRADAASAPTTPAAAD